jgi:hypothetical protein
VTNVQKINKETVMVTVKNLSASEAKEVEIFVTAIEYG